MICIGKVIFKEKEVASPDHMKQMLASELRSKGLVQKEEANGFFGYEQIEVEVVDEKEQARLPQREAH
jgi:hypothetical protein